MSEAREGRASKVCVARLDELPAGQPRAVEVNGTTVVLARVGDDVYAFEGSCTHQGGPLGEGKLSGSRLTCPWHGWMFDVRTGQCMMPPRGGRLLTCPVRVEGGEIWVGGASG